MKDALEIRKEKIEEKMADEANNVYRCHICGVKVQLLTKPVGLCTCWQCHLDMMNE